MTSNRAPYTVSSDDPMRRHITAVFPGSSAAIVQLRNAVLEFARDPLANSLHLDGPPGVGKSALARNVAFLKWIAAMKREHLEANISNVRFTSPGLIDPVLMPWYVELSLTGLVEELAAAQLFGSVRGAFSGAVDRAGVFEQAMRGRMSGSPPAGAQITGGVVFLDEIGDLPLTLQPRLLPILSGGRISRLGAEGQEDHEFTFTGVTITASWRQLRPPHFRPDLLSRIGGFVVRVPALADRMEDFEDILEALQTSVVEQARTRLERLKTADPRTIDRAALEKRIEDLRPLTGPDRQRLTRVAWGKYGNLRALQRVLEQVIAGGRSIEDAISGLSVITEESKEAEADIGMAVLNGLLVQPADGRTLSAHVKQFERDQRDAFQGLLTSDPAALSGLCSHLRVSERQVKDQLYQLTRRRVSDRGEDGSSAR